ncbi:MAG TPA: phytoene/squalene synthase family protein, partial [Ktedonobacteraceae bacterium]
LTIPYGEHLFATHSKTFHFATRFFPATYRHPVTALYAFFRTLDDLVDEPEQGRNAQKTLRELDAWQNWFLHGRTSPAPREPLGSKLDAVLREYPIPHMFFLDFLDGLASDLEPQTIRTFAEMYSYCYRVAGTVGLAMATLFGLSSDQALAAAQSLGIAMQLTNILRDVGSDLASGRLYLPQDELARFACPSAHLFALYQDQQGPDPRFRALMRYQIERVHGYYAQGLAGVWLLPSDARLPVLIAGRLYRRILTVIEAQGYDVLRARASTSFPEKLHEAALALTLDLLWRQGERPLRDGREVPL